MPKLLQRDRIVIGRAISNVLSENELDVNVVYVNFAHTTQQGVIIANKMLISTSYKITQVNELSYTQTFFVH